MLAGEPYDAQDPELRAERRACRALCERFNAAGDDPAVLRELLGSLAVTAPRVLALFLCDYGYQITIGARTFINYGCVILDGARVTIGADVQIGPNVQLLTALHPLDPVQRRRGTETAAAVTIGDGRLAAGDRVPRSDRGREHRRRRRQRGHPRSAAWAPVRRQSMPAATRAVGSALRKRPREWCRMANEFSGSAVIERPIADVFAFLADGTNDPKFSPRVQQISKTTDGPIGVGTVFESTVKDAGMKTTRKFELTEFDAPTRIRWTERSKNMVTVPEGGYDLEPSGRPRKRR